MSNYETPNPWARALVSRKVSAADDRAVRYVRLRAQGFSHEVAADAVGVKPATAELYPARARRLLRGPSA